MEVVLKTINQSTTPLSELLSNKHKLKGWVQSQFRRSYLGGCLRRFKQTEPRHTGTGQAPRPPRAPAPHQLLQRGNLGQSLSPPGTGQPLTLDPAGTARTAGPWAAFIENWAFTPTLCSTHQTGLHSLISVPGSEQ